MLIVFQSWKVYIPMEKQSISKYLMSLNGYIFRNKETARPFIQYIYIFIRSYWEIIIHININEVLKDFILFKNYIDYLCFTASSAFLFFFFFWINKNQNVKNKCDDSSRKKGNMWNNNSFRIRPWCNSWS